MADLKDEFGNPIQLTDEHGNPVQLTDEHGNPVKLTGIATTGTTIHETKTTAFDPEEMTRGAADTGIGAESVPEAAVGAVTTEVHGKEKAEIVGEGDEGNREQRQQVEKEQGTGEHERSSSTSSSGTSEEDEHGVRTKKKKKGLTQKIKEKLTGGKHKEKEEHPAQTTGVYGSTTITTTTTGLHNEHEKKSVIEKIKEKLPGHHTHA